jgi:hypothetical protein
MKIHLLWADFFPGIQKVGQSDMTKPTVAVHKFTSKRKILEKRNDLMFSTYFPFILTFQFIYYGRATVNNDCNISSTPSTTASELMV